MQSKKEFHINTIQHKNLKELCRACLRTLKNSSPSKISESGAANGVDDFCGSSNKNNDLLLPNLCKIFRFLTTYDVKAEFENFPKTLCTWCYGKLMDYEEFRKMALKSTEMLYAAWSSREEEKEKALKGVSLIEGGQHTNELIKVEEGQTAPQRKRFKLEQIDDSEIDDDDQLLLPELANMPMNIKHEPLFEAMDTQLTLPSFTEQEQEIEQDHLCYDDSEDEDDADDEELLLPNGAANNSSPSIYTNDGKAAKHVLSTKRDRDKKSLYCNTCNKQFYKQIYLDAHMRGTHLGLSKPFQCPDCPKAFTRYKQLYHHKKSIHEQQQYRCEYHNCGATFLVEVKLKSHFQIVHNSGDEIISPDYQEQGNDEGDQEMDHICQMCWRKYSSKRALREHIKRHNQVKEHVCPECGVAKVTRTELQTHMRIHTPNLEKFPCPQCPQVFNHKNAISRHVRVIHEGLKRFQCTHCPKRFGTRNSQVCHERLHTGERPFTCEICQKAFVQQEGLRSHMKNHDKNLRTHVCKFCSQRFITLKNLIDHERRHASDKPHICNICSKGFYKEEDLRIHRTTHYEVVDGNADDQDVLVEPEHDWSSQSSKAEDESTYSSFH